MAGESWSRSTGRNPEEPARLKDLEAYGEHLKAELREELRAEPGAAAGGASASSARSSSSSARKRASSSTR